MHVTSADTTVADTIRYTQYWFQYDTNPLIVRSLFYLQSDYLSTIAASEMTYIVSGGALNSTHLLTCQL